MLLSSYEILDPTCLVIDHFSDPEPIRISLVRKTSGFLWWKKIDYKWAILEYDKGKYHIRSLHETRSSVLGEYTYRMHFAKTLKGKKSCT